jgi:para-aminobenzoate synthetase component 1
VSAAAERRESLEVVHLLEEVKLEQPFWHYYEAYRTEPYSFLFDSARDPEDLGRYSFLGGDPELVFEAKRIPGAPPSHGARISVLRRRTIYGQPLSLPARESWIGDVFAELAQTFEPYRVSRQAHAGSPVPFLGGAVGYLGYECAYLLEKLPDRGTDDLQLPEVCLFFVDCVLAHDHQLGKTYVSAIGRGESSVCAHANAKRALGALRDKIAAFERSSPKKWTGPSDAMRPTTTALHGHADEAAYAETVRRAKEHIFAGDCFEVCTTHRLEASFDGDPWDLYRELRRLNPAPFSCFLSLPWGHVVSSSPERFVRLDTDGIVQSRPMKGTRPRGATREADAATREDLSTNLKDRAENVMIVDLVRNDLGRVCKIDSVHVPELFVVEEYATVFQLVSTIQGQLRSDCNQFDLIKASFPGGSMTGAPKIEAMKIIDELEPYKRGIYSGAIGYFDYAGTVDLNIVIRTIVVKDGRCYFSVGGAVVADSDPVGEYRESMDKARALIRAVENVNRVNRHDNSNHR